jgi:hypothetical protein
MHCMWKGFRVLSFPQLTGERPWMIRRTALSREFALACGVDILLLGILAGSWSAAKGWIPWLFLVTW